MTTLDEKLVQDFLKGNDAALEALVSKYLKPLLNFVFQLVKDQTVAEDIVQDTFFKVWKNLEKFDANKKFSTWIFAIAKNTAFDYLKKKKTLAFSAFENEEGESWLENVADERISNVEDLLAKFDDEKHAEEILATLSPQMRSVLLLHHTYGFSLVEAAGIMKTPHNTLKSKYRRTLIDLRKKFSNKFESQKRSATRIPGESI